MTMIHGEIPAPLRQPGLPGDQRCELARKELSVMLAEQRMLSEMPILRDHLTVCEDCNALYRSSLLDDARLRRAMVEIADHEDSARVESERPRRAVLSPIAIARAGFTASTTSARGKASWVILLAAIAYVAVRLTPDPSGVARARLEALAGEVLAVGEPLAPGAVPRELGRGDWVRTTKGALARLTFGQSEVELAESTEVQVEEPATRRLRLESGSIDVQGPLLVTSLYGFVRVESGRATLTIDGQRLLIESAQGNVRTIDSIGEREIAPGEITQLAFAR